MFKQIINAIYMASASFAVAFFVKMSEATSQFGDIWMFMVSAGLMYLTLRLDVSSREEEA